MSYIYTDSTIIGSAGIIGHIRPSGFTHDEGGWYYLDGRAKATLPAAAQAAMTTLGLTTLPVMTNLSERQYGTLLSTSGTDTPITLTNANLPNIDYNGTLDRQLNPHNHPIANDPAVRRNLAGQVTGTAQNKPVKMGPVINVPATNPGGAHTHAWQIPYGVANPIPLNKENGYLSTHFHIYLGDGS